MRLLSLAAVAALALPAVAHAQTVDRTVTCPVATVSGVPSVDFAAGVSRGAAAWTIGLKPDTGQPMELIGAFGGKPGGVTVGTTCRKAAQVPLTRGSLPRFTVLDAVNHVIEETCNTGSRVVVHLRTTISHGSAVSGQMSMSTGTKRRSLLYITWTPFNIAIYQTNACSYG